MKEEKEVVYKVKKEKTIAELKEKRIKKIEKIAELKKDIIELGNLINAKVKGGEK